ncbi:MAG: hypothetical protein IJX71_02030, partial [Oscillospiraceae bacterium]|nr:hypothetical protein [Oscillospiraceae bacterium]
FAYKTINKEDILQMLAKAATHKAGRPINAVAKNGAPPAAPVSKTAAKSASANDPFQDLIRKGRELGADIQ